MMLRRYLVYFVIVGFFLGSFFSGMIHGLPDTYILGINSTGGANFNLYNRAHSVYVNTTEPGSISSILVYIAKVGTTNRASQCAIYWDSNKTFIASTASVSITSTVFSWKTYSFSSPVVLGVGNYLIIVRSEGAGVSLTTMVKSNNVNKGRTFISWSYASGWVDPIAYANITYSFSMYTNFQPTGTMVYGAETPTNNTQGVYYPGVGVNTSILYKTNDDNTHLDFYWTENASAQWYNVSGLNYQFATSDPIGFEGALNGTDNWGGGIKGGKGPPTDSAIIDLGGVYNVSVLRGRSKTTGDPTSITATYSLDNISYNSWISSITTWQDTTDWVEYDCPDVDARYLQFTVKTYEGIFGLDWGTSNGVDPYSKIIDVKCNASWNLYKRVEVNNTNGAYVSAWAWNSNFSQEHISYKWKVVNEYLDSDIFNLSVIFKKKPTFSHHILTAVMNHTG